jgi:DNA-binding GntR family transcriptional regulator
MLCDMAVHTLHSRHHAYASFTKKLLARDILPGQFVSQRELVELTGMRLGAIREMIPRLEADGLVRTVPKRGLQVLTVDLNLIRDAFQLRRMIEVEAIINFCRTATADEIEQIAAEHQEILTLAENRIDDALLARAQRVDWAFHDQIVDHMQNRIISEIYRVNSIKIRLIANSNVRISPRRLAFVMAEHLPILQAVRARDEAAAATAINAHIDSAKKRVLGS